MTFRQLNKWLQSATMQQIVDALKTEIKGNARKSYLKRIHQRYCALRAAKERKELGL